MCSVFRIELFFAGNKYTFKIKKRQHILAELLEFYNQKVN